MSDRVGNPEDRFSPVAAHMQSVLTSPEAKSPKALVTYLSVRTKSDLARHCHVQIV